MHHVREKHLYASKEERKPHHLGEILVGDRMMKTLFVLPFLISFEVIHPYP
jgi:hypothetical protein